MRKAIIILGVLVSLPFGYYFLILDWQGRPYCHKQIMGSLLVWIGDREGGTNSVKDAFPNVNGSSWDSMMAITDEMNGTNWARGYKYVPGLREEDPGDLVLFYVDTPTRWTWHGNPPTIFRKKEWIIVPVDFCIRDRSPVGQGELSERVTKEEFVKRLKKTIEFVRTNERPNWQTVVAEHTRFLESIGKDP